MANGLCQAQVTWCQAISQMLQLQAAWTSPGPHWSDTPSGVLGEGQLEVMPGNPRGLPGGGGLPGTGAGPASALSPAGRTWQAAPGSGLP